MALTESQLTSLRALLAEIESLAARCHDRLLTLEEAKGKLTEMWDKSRAILQPDSDEWRYLDRAQKEAPGWWREERSGYVASGDARRFIYLQEVLKLFVARDGHASDAQQGRAAGSLDKPQQQPQRSEPHEKYKYDVAISFADPERGVAEKLAVIVRAAGYSVFYDRFYQEDLWGKDLAQFFQEIFGSQSRFCVVFVSQEYLDRTWTIYELRTAVGRSIQKRGKEYILPVQVGDPLELPGVPSQVGYVAMRNYSIDQIGKLLVKKLGKVKESQ